MHRRWSALAVGGILVLGACGQEEAQPAEQGTDVADHEMDKGDHDPDGAAAEDEPESSSVDPAGAAEAKSGTASPLLAQGEATSFVFSETGEFPIHCEAHPDMQMKVIVEEGASASGEAAVEIADFAYGEAELTVAPGTVVTWTNKDEVRHNVFIE
jgi:plastocyanin